MLLLSCKTLIATEYFPYLDGIPIIDSCEILPQYTIILDHPDGKIIEYYCQARKPFSEIQQFYANILPNLGYEKVNNLQYIRTNTIITLDFMPSNAIVSFKSAPR